MKGNARAPEKLLKMQENLNVDETLMTLINNHLAWPHGSQSPKSLYLQNVGWRRQVWYIPPKYFLSCPILKWSGHFGD
jgi:hypothetical protein